MDRVTQTMSHKAADAHIYICRVAPESFAANERGTLLNRVLRSWDTVGLHTDSGFLLPHEGALELDLRNNEENLVLTGTAPTFELDESRFLGVANPFDSLFRSLAIEAALARDLIYLRVNLEIGGTVWEFYRLIVPLVNSGDEVSKVVVANRFIGETVRLVSSPAMSFTRDSG